MGIGGLIIWLIFGGLIGWLASIIMHDRESLLMNIIVGIVGSLIGGFLFGVVRGGGTRLLAFRPIGFVVSLIGAMILLGIINLFRRGRVR
ncbi:MAG: GlsB/YeaQ/YmgE family stress response membrane protein [Herpetosiphonaceae bacterium]|nr:GlsB/YeaQ/YmgE family stress response membrane protein [Herpetosiphonaceae bacterium]